MYADLYSKEITRKLTKLKKKDSQHYQIVRKRIDWILANPEHRYKDLRYDMEGLQRVHIGHFVLVFSIDHIKKTVTFGDYDHHDKIYRN